MQRRQITLEDGRYLIFYTFDDETASPSTSVAEDAAAATRDESSPGQLEEPVAEPQATEERHV